MAFDTPEAKACAVCGREFEVPNVKSSVGHLRAGLHASEKRAHEKPRTNAAASRSDLSDTLFVYLLNITVLSRGPCPV